MNDSSVNTLKGKRVLIFQQRGWGVKIGHYLAQQMQKEGCVLAALTLKKSTHAFTTSQKDVHYEVVLNDDEVAEDPEKYLGDDQYTLSDVCLELGIDSVWPFMTTLRHYVRTYSDKYYYGFKQNMSDREMELYMLAVFKYIKYFFDTFYPDAIIAPRFGDLRHIFFCLFAQRKGVPMIAVTDSKIRDYHIFSHGYLSDTGLFYERVDELNSGKVESPNRKRAQKYVQEFRQEFIRPEYAEYNLRKKTLSERFEEELAFLREIKGRLAKTWAEENPTRLGINPGNPTVRIMLRDRFAHFRNTRFMENFSYYPFGKIDKFVYTPLQVQPEMTIDVMGPFFNNQIETIRQVAQSMPDNYTLVVREHPAAVGRRAISYIEKISRTPNVKLIDYRIPTKDVLTNAAMVISTSSTTVAETAFYSKPVIQLGNLGTTLKLPNVFHHTDMTTLSKKIKETLEVDLSNKEYEFKLENYVAAAYDTGFNFNYIGTWLRNDKSDLEPLWLLFKKEIERALTLV